LPIEIGAANGHGGGKYVYSERCRNDLLSRKGERMNRWLVSLFLLGLSVGADAQAPTPGQPAQPSPTQRQPARSEAPLKGSAVIRGQVVSAESGAPIRRAYVRAMSAEGRSGGVTSTDAQGRFEIRDVAAGRYTITATKGGLVSLQYGQKRPGQPGTPLDILEKQIVEKVIFALPRGSVITGRLMDESGEPLAGARVTAQQLRFVGGVRRLMQAGTEGAGDTTDDQGHFRLYGLAPGDYYINGMSRGAAALGFEQTNSNAEGFAPTFFPGTVNPAEAQRITLRTGQEFTANFSLHGGRMARVSGRVVNAEGQPIVRGLALLSPITSGMSIGSMTLTGATQPDGTFEIANVPPGRYQLLASQGGSTGGPEPEHAKLTVTVGTEDVENLHAVTAQGAVATGRIVTADGTPLPIRPESVQLTAPFGDPPAAGVVFATPRPTINGDGTFEMRALFDRKYINATVPGGAWVLAAVLHNGVDVTDTPIDFEPGRRVDGLEVVLTSKISELSGVVTDDRGRPALDASVVVFPRNPDRWIYQSRYLRSARPDQQGRFVFKNLPPRDEYLLVAVRDLEEGRFADPEFLQTVREVASRVSLGEGETKVHDLKVSQVQ
jgi:hypothetical protein